MNEAIPSLPHASKEIKLTPFDKARFWKKVNKDGPLQLHMESSCWMWTKAKDRNGYGRFWSGTQTIRAHRAAWTLANGPISPDNICVCHRCDNPGCVNPEHLFLGSNADNTQDMITKGRKVVVSGDRHYARLYPERVARGQKHGSHTKPESVRRGDKHHSKTKPECLARGEASATAKLFEANVINIRITYAAGGTTLQKLADQFGVSMQAIHLIVTRKNWKHIQ